MSLEDTVALDCAAIAALIDALAGTR